MNDRTPSGLLKPIATNATRTLAILAAATLAIAGCGEQRKASAPPAPTAPTESTTPTAAPSATEAAAAAPAPAPAPAPAAEPAPAAAPASAPVATPAAPAEAPKDNVKMSKEYWPNGKLKYTYEMRKSANGKWAKNGIGRAYYDTGPLEREGPYKNNVRVGKWTYYAPDGKVLRTEERGTDGKGGNAGDPPLP